MKGKRWVSEVLKILSSITRDLLIHTFQKRYSSLGEKTGEPLCWNALNAETSSEEESELWHIYYFLNEELSS